MFALRHFTPCQECKSTRRSNKTLTVRSNIRLFQRATHSTSGSFRPLTNIHRIWFSHPWLGISLSNGTLLCVQSFPCKCVRAWCPDNLLNRTSDFWLVRAETILVALMIVVYRKKLTEKAISRGVFCPPTWEDSSLLTVRGWAKRTLNRYTIM